MNDLQENTDYVGSIIHKWDAVIYELDELRARKVDLGARIKELVTEQRKLRPLVRMVAPDLVRNGDNVTPDE